MNDDDKRMMAIMQNGNNGDHYYTIGPTVFLTEDELALAERVGRVRNEMMNKMNLSSTNRNLPDKENMEIMAVAAEIAVAKHLNLYFEYRLPLVPGSCDMKLNDGRGIDVKFTTYGNGKLIVPVSKRNSCSVYVLAINTNGSSMFNIAGWATAEELFNEENIVEMYGKKKYVMHQIQLSHIKDLI
jgi:hypothetical protein